MLRRLIVLLAFLLVSPVCQAQTPDPHIAELKTLFQKIMDNNAKAGSGATVQYDGALTVEPVQNEGKSYYAVTMPHAIMHYPAGDRLEIGMISVNVTAGDSAGEWKMAFAIPTPILGYNSANQEIMRIALGTQKAAGLWKETLETFSKFESLYKNVSIAITPPEGQKAQIDIPSLALKYNLTEDGAHRWSGPMTLDLLQTTWRIPSEGITGHMDTLAANSTLDQLSPEVLKALLSQTPDAGHPPAPDTMTKAWNGLKGAFSITGLQSGTVTDSFAVNTLTLQLGFQDILSGTLSADALFQCDGLKILPVASPLARLIPEKARFHTALKNVPVDSMAQSLGGGVTDSIQNPQMAGMGLMMQAPALLGQSGTTFEIDNTALSNPLYQMTLDSIVRADPASTTSATADGRLAFKGIENILSLLQSTGVKEQVPPQAASFLTALKTFSLTPNTTDPNTTHTFSFKMDQTGGFTINGKNGMMLLFSGMAPSAPAGETSPPAVPVPSVTP